jgi:drug/metabolite transporter (DMT)-like permease
MSYSQKSWHVSPYLLLTLTVLFWASNWVVSRAIRNDIPPIALAFWRWAIASLALLPFAWQPTLRQWPLIRAHWRALTVLAITGIGLCNALGYWGVQYTTATNGVLLNSATPILIVAISAVFFGERMTMRQNIGAALSVMGVLTIIAHGHLETLISLTPNVGDFWVLGSVLAWAIYTVCLRWRPMNLHPLAFLWMLMLIGLLPMLPLYLWEISSGRQIVFNAGSIATLAYVGVFPSLLGYIFWNRGVAAVGANRAGLFIHLMPVFGTLLSFIFLKEQPQTFQMIGIGLIFIGIYLTTRVTADQSKPQ